MAKKKSNEKSGRTEEKAKNKDSKSFSWWLPIVGLILALLPLLYKNYFVKTSKPDGDANELKSLNYPIERVTTNDIFDNDGYVVNRRRGILKLMPANESSKYQVSDVTQLSPYVEYLPGPPMSQRRERAMGARFRNFYDFDLTKWWDDGSEEGVYSGILEAHGDTATNTYTTHTFIFRKQSTNEFVDRITMRDDQHLYFLGPDKDDEQTLQSERYLKSLKEIEFMREYHAKNGVPWLSHFPRGPPELFLYPTDFVGQVHTVISYAGYHESAEKQSKEPVELKVTVVATQPKVLLIENLMNDFEVDHVIRMGEKVVKRSMVGSGVGGFQSSTRTSENGWLQRKHSKVLNEIYYRFSDVLQMTDKQMQDNSQGSIENLQFVRYLESQRYDPHHDFGYTGRTEQRFSTLLLYLEVPEGGGGTSFPKAFNGQGISVKPTKGDAVLFYSMLPDGNGDDFSLHAGMPVTSGRKYICNLWSWDPKYQ